ncbi:nuclear protein MDM1-like isoform X3 [Mya arenaria]|uniref:nuclear protein MDM1-like isoform X3 n=1 Tax=Mya arenaria TaxID=6604 RepID=UPI0022E4F646|nr:nuclear protein MDM1-like isoform X3 [Mya arenaria]
MPGEHKLGVTCSEPALQSKKRVEPPFLKTVPAKSDFDGVPLQSKKRVPSPPPRSNAQEPVMQAKKRVLTDLTKSSISKPLNIDPVPIQSKKRVEKPGENKPVQSEPPLQSKRRTPGIPATLINGFHGDGGGREEYTLLGNQDKFTENVKYKVKSNMYTRDISPPKQRKIQQKENKAPSPSRAPVVDTRQYGQPETPLAPRRPKSQPAPEVRLVKEVRMSKELKVAQEPKVSKEPQMTKSSKVASNDVRQSRIKYDEARNLDRAGPVKESQKVKRIENMNEITQTNMEKGIADSVPEAPADYALKYKTGISAPRPTKKLSEYQKQFQWKAGMPASPLLKAEQNIGPKEVVYNSNPQLSPPKKSVVSKVTEYQKQFREYKLVPVPREEQDLQPSKKVKLQKSKSMEDLSPAEIKPAGSAPVITPNNKRLTMATDQKQPDLAPEVPTKKNRAYHSEYNSNYKPPTRFDYVRGSWQGAKPPQLKIRAPEETTQGPVLANWFAEVIELRRKAQEYRQRALGTHFSREHLVQLMAKQTELWEASNTSARSTVSALNLETGLRAQKQARPTVEDQAARRQAYWEGGSMAATLPSEEDDSTARLSVLEEIPAPSKEAWVEQEPIEPGLQTPSTFSASRASPDPELFPVEGESQQPAHVRSQSTLKSAGNRRRHHLDRTTPSLDGAILGASEAQKKHRSGKRIVSKSVDSVSLGTMDEPTPRYETPIREHRPLAGQKTYTACSGRILATPTCGLPSRDTHALRDDDASTDRPLQTQFVDNIAKPRLTPGLLSTIGEGFGQTYNKTQDWQGLHIPRCHVDDDVKSISTRSFASSCSLASATLERARKRSQDFWGKSDVSAK